MVTAAAPCRCRSVDVHVVEQPQQAGQHLGAGGDIGLGQIGGGRSQHRAFPIEESGDEVFGAFLDELD